MQIETEHLTLALQSTADILAWVDSLDAVTRAEISPDWLERIHTSSAPDPQTHSFAIVHRASGTSIGSCAYKGPPDTDQTVEIAYGVDPAYQGRGFATEAAQALVAYAMHTGQVRMVRAHTRPEGKASMRVLEKLGFTYIGKVINPEDGLVLRWELRKEAPQRVVRSTRNDKALSFAHRVTGSIAGLLPPALRQRYDLRLTDARSTDRQSQPVEGVIVADLLAASAAELAPLVAGVDTIVHCAYHRPAGDDIQSQYDGARRNVDLMQRVYQLALDHGVRRVVAASTNQAAKWYEQPYYAGLRGRVSPEDYPRPDNLYGWAKAAYETLGFVYACGSLGRKLEIVQLRIVAPREIDAGGFAGRPLAH